MRGRCFCSNVTAVQLIKQVAQTVRIRVTRRGTPVTPFYHSSPHDGTSCLLIEKAEFGKSKCMKGRRGDRVGG